MKGGGHVSFKTKGRAVVATPRVWTSIALACAIFPKTAQAQERSMIQVSGNIEAATDDRFRGYTRSAGEPVVRASLDATVEVGNKTTLFSGATVSLTEGNPDYGSFQTHFYAGIEQELGAFHLTIGGRGYIFPDVENKGYYEVFGSGHTQLGPVSATIGVAFAPSQRHIANRRGVYVYSDVAAGIPNTPVTVAAHLGWDDNAQFSGKSDWSLSLTYVHTPWSLGISYVDTNRAAPFVERGRLKNGAGAGMVATLGASF
jgi:uncharacterized protein (TIGR02001 family)